MFKIHRLLLLLAISLFCSNILQAQGLTVVTGTVRNSATKESISAVSVTIKGTNVGAFTDDRGNFKFTTVQKPPFTLLVSSVGFTDKEIQFNGEASVSIELEVSFAVGTEVVVGATRLPTRIMEAPVSVERVSSANIRNTPGASYYDALNNLKGVDITTSSYTFKTVSTRGFNGSGNLRFNQLVDGMDNAAPSLNFSVGNVIGLTELDVDNMELLQGATSALYGSGGMNGTLLITSKDPFKYQGVSFQIKQGVNHISDYRHNAAPFYDWSLRWGKKVSEKFAFKIGAEYISANDWQANDTTNLLRNNVISNPIGGTRASDPNYDGVNVFGDEASASMQQVALAGIFGPSNISLPGVIQTLTEQNEGTPPTQAQIIGFYAANPQISQTLWLFANGVASGAFGNQLVSRTGYYENNIVDYDAKNLKFSGGLYFYLTHSTELSVTGNWGYGTSVYTGADRYSLKNFQIGQYKLEIKNPNWFFRAYTTQENSGDSYASTLTALSINEAWKPSSQWFGEYAANYEGAILQGASSAQANALARTAADAGRYLPGSQQFNQAFNNSVTTSISNGGSQFKDNSNVYQLEGQYNFTPMIKVLEVLTGASYRWYNLRSHGTIFADAPDLAGNISISEIGAYVQLGKSLFKDYFKITASGRYDKNENFEGRFTPRVTGLIKVAKDNHFRISYQQAYRFPNNQDQWINLQTPGSILIGCLPFFNTYYHFDTNPVYTAESVLAFRASGGNPSSLQRAEFKKAVPETMESVEIGYRGILAKKLLVDAYYYFSTYKNFIGRAAVARGATQVSDLISPFTTVPFSFVENSPTPVKARGWGIGGEYQAGHGYKISANVYGDQLKDVPSGLVTFFNTPKTRFNLGFANPNVYKGLGFNILYKWQDKVSWEGTFAAGEIPSFGTMDFLLSYKIGKTKNLVKLGATNLFNHYYRNAFGNPYVGGLYYVSFGYNVF